MLELKNLSFQVETENGKKDILRTVVSKLADLEKVGGHTGHDLTRFVLVIEGEGKLLNVREEVAAHLSLHSDTDEVTVILNEIAQKQSDDIKHKNDCTCGDYHFCGLCSVKECLEHCFGDDGIDHTDKRDNQRGEHIKRQHPAVRFVVSNKSF